MKQESMGIHGYIKVFITDNKTGVKRLVFEDKNAIQAAYANMIVDELHTGFDYTMDALFNGNLQPPTNGEDGIAIKDVGGLWYEMDMDTSIRTLYEVLFVGAFTGTGITVPDAASVNLGHNYAAPFATIIALPSSWPGAGVAVLNTETLTIEWTIKHWSS